MKEGKNKTWKRVFIVILSIFIVTSIFNIFFKECTVYGVSMNNNYYKNDVVIIDKTVRDYKRFDVVVVKNEKYNYIIKRIIAMPNETVQIINGYIYIDGKKLNDDVYKFKMEYYGLADKPIKLSKGQYFVLGDNRNESEDSRYESIGNVNKEDVIGKVFYRIYPISRIGKTK